jgi:hypothetical protein
MAMSATTVVRPDCRQRAEGCHETQRTQCCSGRYTRDAHQTSAVDSPRTRFFTSCSVNNLTQSAVCVRGLFRMTKLRSGLSRGLLSSKPHPSIFKPAAPSGGRLFFVDTPLISSAIDRATKFVGRNCQKHGCIRHATACFGLARIADRAN